ncbi:MAG: sulfite exporter TauE/SafE family protein [Bacteroidetes bacterium]|nr:sulfite exporter TauE/SafE family protein [Bacteroidota bacterium]
MNYYILVLAFFAIALIYSSVGFGGGSSYLALLAVLGIGFETLRPTALLCNIVVVTGGTIIFFREGQMNFKKIMPFILVSIPMAFLGGYWPVKQHTFFVLLGITLMVASVLLWFQNGFQKKEGNPPAWSGSPVLNSTLGGSIGFLSGLVSIGGGIFLSPVLHLLRWDVAKKISALASVFILVNSVSGLAGQLARNATIDWELAIPLMVAVLAGGQIGSRLGARKFNATYIKRITAALIMAAAINILIKHW